MKKPSQMALSLLTLACWLGLGQASAATYYVAKTGGNAHSCAQAQSPSTPKQTINGGIACLSGGDTLLIGNGSYHELLTNHSVAGHGRIPNGSPAAYTILKAQNTGQVTLTFTPFADFWSGIELDGSSSYIHFEGFVLDGQNHTTNGISFATPSHHLRFQDLLIHHVATMGIEGRGSDHEFLNVSMHHIAWTDAGTTTCPHTTCARPPGENCHGFCHPYYVFGSGHLIDGGTYTHSDGWVFHWYASDSLIRNTTVRDANVGAGLMGARNVFYNNVIVDVAIGVFMDPSSTVVHNTLYGTHPTRTIGGDTFGILVPSGSGGHVANNLLLQQRQDALVQTTGSHNLCDRAATGGCTVIAASPLAGRERAGYGFPPGPRLPRHWGRDERGRHLCAR